MRILCLMSIRKKYNIITSKNVCWNVLGIKVNICIEIFFLYQSSKVESRIIFLTLKFKNKIEFFSSLGWESRIQLSLSLIFRFTSRYSLNFSRILRFKRELEKSSFILRFNSGKRSLNFFFFCNVVMRVYLRVQLS